MQSLASADSKEKSDRPIGIALSGGGHRATAFSLGVLLYLVESGLNERVKCISSVSGGSITNAYVAVSEVPFDRVGAQEFARQAARLAQRIAGSPRWWWGTIITFCASALAWGAMVALDLLPAWTGVAHIGLFTCVALPPIAIFMGPRSGGTMWAWRGTWLYCGGVISAAAALVWLIFVPNSDGVGVVLSRAVPSWLLTSIVLTALLLWGYALSRRGWIADLAFDRFLCWAVPATRRPTGLRILLADTNSQPHHVFCATEMQGAEHAYLSDRGVHSGEFGFGEHGGLPLSTAVQVSANFPGGFPLRHLPAHRHFGPDHKRGARWMIMSDGGVYDNLADSWFLEMETPRQLLAADLQNEMQRSSSYLGVLSDKLKVLHDSARHGKRDKKTAREADFLEDPDLRASLSNRERAEENMRRLGQQMEATQSSRCSELIVANASSQPGWQQMRGVSFPLLGELLGFVKTAGLMYNSVTGTRIRDLRKLFAVKKPRGSIVAIDHSLPFAKSAIFYLKNASACARGVDQARLERVVAYLELHGDNHKAEELDDVTRVASATPTTLRPLGVDRTAKLVYHGYLQAMLSAYMSLEDCALIEPPPTLERFEAMASGQVGDHGAA